MNRSTQLLILRIFLAALAVFNLAKYTYSVYTNETDDNPMDFRVFWTATKVQAEGENYYDDTHVKEMWRNVAVNENLTTSTSPGFPNTGVTYPPWFPVIFKPFTLFNWGTARYIIILLNIILLGFSLYLFKHTFNIISWLSIILVVFAFKGTSLALFTGNPLFISFFLVLVSLFLFSKNKKLLSGIFLGLASFKISLVFPFVIFFLIRWEWKILFTSLAVLLIQAAIIMLPYQNPMLLVHGFFNNMAHLWELGVANTIDFNTLNSTEFATIIGYFITSNKTALALFNYGGLIITLILIGWLNYKHKLSNTLLLSLLCLAGLVFTHHFIYDGLILLFILPALLELRLKQTKWIVGLNLPLLLPITGIAFKLPFNKFSELLLLHLPFTLMALLITLFIFAVKNNRLKGGLN